MSLRKLMTRTTFALILAVGVSVANAQKMYWTEHNKIQRADLDGSNVEALITTGLSRPMAIALDVRGGKMYWADYETQKVQRAYLDGSNIEVLATTDPSRPAGIALDLDAGTVYWGLTSGGPVPFDNLQRADLDGSNVKGLVGGLGLPIGIALDIPRGKMYWVDLLKSKIQRANLNGSIVEDIPFGFAEFPMSVALDLSADKLYWTMMNSATIYRINLDGSGFESFISEGLNSLTGVALDLDAGKMYWTDFGGKIQRANLDGSNVEDLITTGLNEPHGIALDLFEDPNRVTGTCCDGQSCLAGGITQAHCEGTFAGAIFRAGKTCADACACRDCQLFGDVFPSGPLPGNCIVDLDDTLFILAAFADDDPAINFPSADLFPCGSTSGVVDVDDVLSVLAAFAGNSDCPHPCPP